MKLPKLRFSALQQPKAIIKFPELVFGIICLILIKYGYFDSAVELELAFIVYGSSIIISPCILFIYLFAVEEEPKPYLEGVLNFVASALYLTMSAITLSMSKSCEENQECFRPTIALGMFSLLNTAAYSFDTYFTFKLLHDFDSDAPIDVLKF